MISLYMILVVPKAACTFFFNIFINTCTTLPCTSLPPHHHLQSDSLWKPSCFILSPLLKKEGCGEFHVGFYHWYSDLFALCVCHNPILSARYCDTCHKIFINAKHGGVIGWFGDKGLVLLTLQCFTWYFFLQEHQGVLLFFSFYFCHSPLQSQSVPHNQRVFHCKMRFITQNLLPPRSPTSTSGILHN